MSIKTTDPFKKAQKHNFHGDEKKTISYFQTLFAAVAGMFLIHKQSAAPIQLAHEVPRMPGSAVCVGSVGRLRRRKPVR